MSQTLYLNAVQHHRAGHLEQAETLYRQLLTANPRHADALHMLGVVYLQTQRIHEALDYIAKALTIHPNQPEFLNHYALALKTDGQLDAAIKHFQQGILQHPKDLDLQINLANTLLAAEREEEAAGYYRRLLKAAPHHNDIREALGYCLTTLGNQAHHAGQYAQAEACFEEALTFEQRDAAIFYNLANAQRELGKSIQAAENYTKAIQLNPNDADAYNNLGNVQRELGQLDVAIANYQKALKLNPQLYHAKVHLVHQKQHICDWEGLTEAINEIRHWVDHAPHAQISPFAFLAMPGTTATEQKQCADHWVRNRYQHLIQHAEQHPYRYDNPSPKIRIGYMSADFRLHPLAFLVSELLELHDRSQFEVHGFSYGFDDKTEARTRLIQAFDHFHDIRLLSELEAADKINACNIDLLIDLTGFTQTSRSGIVALRPAPISINWLGFPGTMGGLNDKPLFDYLLTDHFITPASSQEDYAETLLALPHSYQPNDRKRPVAEMPSRKACGLPEDTFVFCCFNQSFKITADFFECWLEILRTVPNSVLWLLECNRWAKDNLLKHARQRGIDPTRLIFAPRVSIAEHLARHAHADLILDTLPYNAHTTCSDALWMEVPVLTCVGSTFAGRVAASLLKTAGLDTLITYALSEYQQRAIELATDQRKRNQLKQQLAHQKSQSALFDTEAFCKGLEAIYQSIWSEYTKKPTKHP